jgi:hypothetical protein
VSYLQAAGASVPAPWVLLEAPLWAFINSQETVRGGPLPGWRAFRPLLSLGYHSSVWNLRHKCKHFGSRPFQTSDPLGNARFILSLGSNPRNSFPTPLFQPPETTQGLKGYQKELI